MLNVNYAAMTREEKADFLSTQPCGCPECSESVQPGHSGCECVGDPHVLELERAGRIHRAYDDGAWRWFIA